MTTIIIVLILAGVIIFITTPLEWFYRKMGEISEMIREDEEDED